MEKDLIKRKEELIRSMNDSLYKMALGDIKKCATIPEGPKLAGFILGSCFVDVLSGFYKGITKYSFKPINKDFAKTINGISISQSKVIHKWLIDNRMLDAYTRKLNINFVNIEELEFPNIVEKYKNEIIDLLKEYYTDFSSGDAYKEFVKKYMPKYNPDNLYSALRSQLVHNYTEGGIYWFTDAKPGKHFSTERNGKILLNLEDFINDIENAYFKFIDDIENDNEMFERAYKRMKSLKLLFSF